MNGRHHPDVNVIQRHSAAAQDEYPTITDTNSFSFSVTMDQENVSPREHQIAIARVESGHPPPVEKVETIPHRLRPVFNIRVSLVGESPLRGGAAQQSAEIHDDVRAASVPNESPDDALSNSSDDSMGMGELNKNGEFEESGNNTLPCIKPIGKLVGSPNEFTSSIGPDASSKQGERDMTRSSTVTMRKKNISPYNVFMSIVRTKLGSCGDTRTALQKMMDDVTFEDIHRRALILVWETKDECKRRRELEKKSMSSKGQCLRLVKFSLLCKDLWCALSPNKKGEYKDALDLANLRPLQRQRLKEFV